MHCTDARIVLAHAALPEHVVLLALLAYCTLFAHFACGTCFATVIRFASGARLAMGILMYILILAYAYALILAHVARHRGTGMAHSIVEHSSALLHVYGSTARPAYDKANQREICKLNVQGPLIRISLSGLLFFKSRIIDDVTTGRPNRAESGSNS